LGLHVLAFIGRLDMTASLEERLLPLFIMLIASMISAVIPIYALRRRRLNFQQDIIFIENARKPQALAWG